MSQEILQVGCLEILMGELEIEGGQTRDREESKATWIVLWAVGLPLLVLSAR